MTTEIVVTTNDGEPSEVRSGEVIEDEVIGESIDVADDAAVVVVAAINADRDVEIAQIDAATRLAEIEAANDERINQLERELASCRMELATALEMNIAMTTELSTRPLLTPPESDPPPNPSENDASEATQVNPEEQTDPPSEPVRKRPMSRWI